jgi:chromosome segregation ATPase
MADDPKTADDVRVAELLRVNRELAVEIRDLTLGRRAEPRRGQMPAARSVAKLRAERDSLEAERESLEAERESVRAQLGAVEGERDALLVHRAELEREVARLRSGLAGMLRRARARLLRSW